MTTCCPESAMHSGTQSHPVAIIGAGPVGLAAAAHLVSRGERPVVLVGAHIAGVGTRAGVLAVAVPPHGVEQLRHPESDFYIVGMKSYGRAPTFLMLTGYEQVRPVVAALVGDIEAARRVELTLPETGVCSSPAAGQCGTDAAPASCCVTEPVVVAATLSAPGRR